MRPLLLLALLLPAAPAAAQSIGTAAQFSDYHVKAGRDDAFLRGYREHLGWHMASDRWPWYVWVVVTGPRRDMYVGVVREPLPRGRRGARPTRRAGGLRARPQGREAQA